MRLISFVAVVVGVSACGSVEIEPTARGCSTVAPASLKEDTAWAVRCFAVPARPYRVERLRYVMLKTAATGSRCEKSPEHEVVVLTADSLPLTVQAPVWGVTVQPGELVFAPDDIDELRAVADVDVGLVVDAKFVCGAVVLRAYADNERTCLEACPETLVGPEEYNYRSAVDEDGTPKCSSAGCVLMPLGERLSFSLVGEALP